MGERHSKPLNGLSGGRGHRCRGGGWGRGKKEHGIGPTAGVREYNATLSKPKKNGKKGIRTEKKIEGGISGGDPNIDGGGKKGGKVTRSLNGHLDSTNEEIENIRRKGYGKEVGKPRKNDKKVSHKKPTFIIRQRGKWSAGSEAEGHIAQTGGGEGGKDKNRRIQHHSVEIDKEKVGRGKKKKRGRTQQRWENHGFCKQWDTFQGEELKKKKDERKGDHKQPGVGETAPETKIAEQEGEIKVREKDTGGSNSPPLNRGSKKGGWKKSGIEAAGMCVYQPGESKVYAFIEAYKKKKREVGV